MEKFTFQDINEAFQSLHDYVQRYQLKSLETELNSIKTRLTMDYKIAIVANMSAGKSTFINALFGEEILPAFNHGTTDSATFIYSTNEKGAVIYFGNGQTFMLAYDNHQKFIKELIQYGQKDEECNDDKHKNVERIDLYYPFKGIYTQNAGEMRIIFVDTPGPNNTGTYEEKHKDQTRRVLNDVDLALFLFDYGQLDANLKSDEQGLWHTIKERHDKDKDFEVFFMLNKIDMALDDNKKYESEWFYHEQKAIDKLRQAAIKHGISAPQIYPISSLYALLRCKPNKDYDDEDNLELFEKKFKRKFGDEWKDELIQYLGIDSFAESINQHIEHKPQQRWEKLATNIKEIIVAEIQRIEQALLAHHDMQNLLFEISGLHNDEIQQLEIARDKSKELSGIVTTSNTYDIPEKITRQAIAFLQAYLNYEYDKQKATFYAVDRNWDFELSAFHKIDVTHQRNLKIGNTLQDTLQDFIQKQLKKIGNTDLLQLPKNVLTYYDTFSKHWVLNGCLLVECLEKILNIPSNPFRVIFDELIETKKKHLATIQAKITTLQEIEEEKKEQLKTLQHVQNLL